MNLLQESLVEVDEILPVVNKRNDDSLLLGCLVSNDGVVDGNSLILSVSLMICHFSNTLTLRL